MQYDDVMTNQIWRTDAISKIVFGYISVPCCPINAKFGERKQSYIDTCHVTRI